MSRAFDVGPGFIRARECPDCFHTRCGESCVCNCDAAHAEYEAAALRMLLALATQQCGDLAEALRAFLAESDGALSGEESDCGWCEDTIAHCVCRAGKARAALARYDVTKGPGNAGQG